VSTLQSKPSPVRALQFFQLMRFATVFVTGIVLARSGMALNEIGLYESLLFLSTATGFFWVNGLGNSLTSRFNPSNERESAESVSATFGLVLIGSLLIASLLWIFKSTLYSITGPEAESVFGWFCLFTLFNNTAFLNETLLLLRRRGSTLIAYGLLNFCLHIGGAVWIILSGKGVESLIQLLLVLAVLKNILLVAQLYRMSTVLPKLSTTLSLGKLAFPLILSMLISGSSEMIDGFLVGHFLGNEAFALFRYGARELPLSGILAAAMSQAMVARFAAEGITREGLMTLKKESTTLMHVVFPVSIVLILLSSWIYPLVFSPAFMESASVFNIYALLVISRMVFPQTLVLALQRHDVIFRISIIELCINVVSSVVLMRWFGMEGIAFGTVIAFISEKCLLYLYVKRHSGIRLTDLLPIRTWLTYALLLLVAFVYTIIR